MRKHLKTKLAEIVLITIWLLMAICAWNKSYGQEKEIRAILEKKGVPPFTIKLLISQARLESGNFTNRLYKEHCNVFSMKHPKVRETASIGPYGEAEGSKDFASYKSLEDSVEDQLLYFKYIGKKPEFLATKQFVHTLKRYGYFEEREEKYLQGILYWNRR